ncbi:MAG TPA: lipopolysaccharide biosynthesis protein [Gemmatimonadaceae bacterium]|nr:lipopolysaccharide biosynthesis protein [Gemmatimonadaceae bacterium]
MGRDRAAVVVTFDAIESANKHAERVEVTKEAIGEAGRDRNLDRSLMTGILWTSAVKWGGQAATWVSTLVVARILGPDAYGLVGMALIYMGLVAILSEFGIGSAVVTLQTLTRHQIAQINTIAVGFGLVTTIISLGAATFVGRAFGVTQVTSIVLALSSTLFLGGLQTIPSALLQRAMRFKLLAIAEGANTILVAALTVILALAGAGFWALVIGQVVGAFVLATVLMIASPSPFAAPKRDNLATALTFSSHTLIARLAWYAFSNADFGVVGRMLGKAALGAYSFGWTMANVPIEKVTSMVLRVTPAVLAAAQHDHGALRRYLLRITEAIAVITFPASIGLALVAEPFVHAALGDAWSSTILPLQLLAVYSGVRSISPLIPQVLTALGNTRLPMRSNLAGAIGFPIAFVIASRWGVAGVAAAWIIVHPFFLAPMYRTAFRAIDLPVKDYVSALWPAISGVAVMAVAVLATRHWLTNGLAALAQLLAMSVVGATAYSLTLLLAHRSRVRALRTMLSELRASG